MRKYIISLIIALILTNSVSLCNSKEKVKIHELCILYYSLMIQPILELKREKNISEFIIVSLDYRIDTLSRLLPANYFKGNNNYINNYDSLVNIHALIYHDSTNCYAKVYTDSSVFQSIRLDLKYSDIFNKKNIKKISFNDLEKSSEVFKGAIPEYHSGLYYWDLKDVYYYYVRYYKSRVNEYCIDVRGEAICRERKKLLDTIHNAVFNILGSLKFEKFHDWEVGD